MFPILLILLLIPAMSNAAQIVKVTEGNPPFVQVSSEDLNHIILPEAVDKAYTSTEKPVDVTVEGKHVFVKLLDHIYHKPIEVFFVGDETYSLILVPVHIPAETIIVTNTFADKKKALSWEREYPYEETIKKLISGMATDKVPDGYSVVEVNQEIKTQNQDRKLFLKKRYAGAELAGEVYFITNMTASTFQVDEKDFFAKQVIAIASEENSLTAFASGNIFIIRRAGEPK